MKIDTKRVINFMLGNITGIIGLTFWTEGILPFYFIFVPLTISFYVIINDKIK